MKRLFLMIVAVLSMTMAFAGNEKMNSVDSTNAYNMSVNHEKLADYLELSSDQFEAVKDIHTSFCVDMLNAANSNGEERSYMVQDALYKDLTYMSYILTKDQYNKYLRVLNATFNNRGLNK
ncbi:MAG: hypothetical protein LUC91_06445 [Prevotella sp.]|nr:hypothetical protein [Prevotella sp.]